MSITKTGSALIEAANAEAIITIRLSDGTELPMKNPGVIASAEAGGFSGSSKLELTGLALHITGLALFEIILIHVLFFYSHCR